MQNSRRRGTYPRGVDVEDCSRPRTAPRNSRFDDETRDFWADWNNTEYHGPTSPPPPPPPYEQPPEYTEERPRGGSRRSRKRRRRRRNASTPSEGAAQPDGPPEYDENERSPFDEDGYSEVSVSDPFAMSCPVSRPVMPFMAYRESSNSRVCPGEAGDVIAIDRGRYEHVVVNVGEEMVIHKVNGEGLVLCQQFSVVAGDDRAFVKNEFDLRWDPFPPSEIVERAYSKVHQKVGYNTVFANCEHFANWCRYGKHKSGQVDEAVSTIGQSVASNGKEMAAAGAKGGVAVGSTLGVVAGGLVGGLLGKISEMITDQPDEPCQVTTIRENEHGRIEIQQVEKKSLMQHGQVVGGLIGGALGLLGGVVGGGLAGLVSGLHEGTGKVAHQYGVNLSQLSSSSSVSGHSLTQLSSPMSLSSHSHTSDDEENESEG